MKLVPFLILCTLSQRSLSKTRAQDQNDHGEHLLHRLTPQMAAEEIPVRFLDLGHGIEDAHGPLGDVGDELPAQAAQLLLAQGIDIEFLSILGVIHGALPMLLSLTARPLN